MSKLDRANTRLARHYFGQVVDTVQKGHSFEQIDKEWEQIESTLNHMVSRSHDGTIDLCLEMIYGLFPYWHVRGMVEQGENWCECAIELCTSLGRTQEKARYLLNLGILHQEFEQLEKAVEILQQALNIFYVENDLDGQRMALDQLGTSYRKLGHLELALENYKHALTICIDTKQGIGVTLGNLGSTYRGLNNSDQAIECFQQALAFFQENQDHRNTGLVLAELGTTYCELGDIDTESNKIKVALGYYQQALDIARETGDRISEGIGFNNLGRSYFLLNKVEESLGAYQQAINIFRSLDARKNEGRCQTNLGHAYYQLGQLNPAQDSYQKSLEIAKQIGDRESEGYSLNNLGNIALAQQEHRQAIDYYLQALSIADELQEYVLEELIKGNLEDSGYDLRRLEADRNKKHNQLQVEEKLCPQCRRIFLDITPCPYCGHIDWRRFAALFLLSIGCLGAALLILVQISSFGWLLIIPLGIGFLGISLFRELFRWLKLMLRPIRKLKDKRNIAGLIERTNSRNPYIDECIIEILLEMKLDSADLEKLDKERMGKVIEVLKE